MIEPSQKSRDAQTYKGYNPVGQAGKDLGAYKQEGSQDQGLQAQKKVGDGGRWLLEHGSGLSVEMGSVLIENAKITIMEELLHAPTHFFLDYACLIRAFKREVVSAEHLHQHPPGLMDHPEYHRGLLRSHRRSLGGHQVPALPGSAACPVACPAS